MSFKPSLSKECRLVFFGGFLDGQQILSHELPVSGTLTFRTERGLVIYHLKSTASVLIDLYNTYCMEVDGFRAL